MKGKGSKKAKGEFYIVAFQQLPEYDAVYRNQQEHRGQIIEAHEDAFKQWKKKNEIVVTARNRLLTLYHAVRVSH